MLRNLVTSLAVAGLLLITGVVLAEEIKGSVVKVDAEKSTITVKVDDKDKEFTVAKDAKILSAKDKPLKDGLKSLKEKAEVILTTEKKDDKEVVTKVQLKGK
ncbi:MAG: hypothetical protein K2R98_28530 [Gemmataceae bacterium]|nr:hypothetical protein [Gemmataceae bacterium]